jgi:two-component system KDP operon response regulator KdpE
VTKGGLSVGLTPTEFRLLAVLARRSGETVGHADLLSAVWGTARAGRRDSLRLHIRSLRRKLVNHEGEPSLLLSQRGVGYRLAAGAA